MTDDMHLTPLQMDAVVVNVFIGSLTLLALTAAYAFWHRTKTVDRAVWWARNAAIGAVAVTALATVVGEIDSRNHRLLSQAVNDALNRERMHVAEETRRAAEEARAAARPVFGVAQN